MFVVTSGVQQKNAGTNTLFTFLITLLKLTHLEGLLRGEAQCISNLILVEDVQQFGTDVRVCLCTVCSASSCYLTESNWL